MKDSTNLPDSIDKRKFSVVRKGFDKNEVRAYLQDLESAFRDLETWSKKAKVQLAEAEERMSSSQAEADGSVDNAMFAVFDAKDRILDKARRRAEQIEAEALEEANEIKARAARLSGESGADELLAAAREEAQDIIARAKRDAGKMGADSVSALEQEMVQKDQQLSSMREQLAASKSDGSGDSPAAAAVIAEAQAKADEIVREAQERADNMAASAEGDGGTDAAAAAILEAAQAQAAEIEARANQLRTTAEEVLADAQKKFAAAREAEEAAAAGASGLGGFGNISDETLMAGMAGELREVHDQVESRRAELTELHDIVEERRAELTEVHDLVEERRVELTIVHDSISGRRSELAELDAEVEARRLELREAFDAAEAQKAEAREAAAQLAAAQADVGSGGGAAPADGVSADVFAAAEAAAADIISRADEDAARIREDAMHMLAETEKERAALQAQIASAESNGDGAGRADTAELEITVSELQASLDKSRQQAAAWSEVVDDMKVQIAEMTAEMEARDAAMASVGDGGDAAASEAQVAELTSQLEAARIAAGEQVSGLEARIAELSTDIEAKTAALAAAEAATGGVAEFESQVASLTAQLEAANAAAGEQASGFEAQIAELSAGLAAKTAEIDATAAESATRVGELEASVAQLTERLATKDAELEGRSAQASEQVAQLEAKIAELTSHMEAKNAEHEAVVADLGQESSALAARLAELHDQAEANKVTLQAAQGQAARVQPLSKELTRVQVALKTKEAELVEAADVISKAAKLAERVGDLETQLNEANAGLASIPMLQAQVDGLKVRTDKAEEAAEFATIQLADIIKTVDEAESDAIRRAAAAEAARIREITEDSLGIAHAATEGTGLDADDYVPTEPVAVAVTSDPDDWSDVFGAADEFMARRAAAAAGDDYVDPELLESFEAEAEAVVEEIVADEPVDDPATEEASFEDAAEEPAAEVIADEAVAEYSDIADDADEATGEVAEELAVGQTDPEPHVQAVDEDRVAELVAADAPAGIAAEDIAAEETAAVEVPEERVANSHPESDAADSYEEPPTPEIEVVVTELEEVHDDPAPIDYPDEPVAEFTEEPVTEEFPAEEFVAEVPVAEEPVSEPVAAVVEEATPIPLDQIPPPVVSPIEYESVAEPVMAEAIQPDPVGQQPDLDVFVAPVEDAAVVPTDAIPAAEATVATVAEEAEADLVDSSEVVAVDMAERLRLARAELEAELHPGTVPAEDIAATAETVMTADLAPEGAADEEVDENTMSGLIRRKAGQTRYARQSAKLPRITESGDEGTENLSSMSGFRARMLRGKSKDAE